MKKQIKAKICILFSVILMLTGVCPVMAEEGQISKQEGKLEGKILGTKIIDGENTPVTISINFSMEDGLTFEKIINENQMVKMDPIDGIQYDKTTNTLSLTDFAYPTWNMGIYNMGSDFKINLTGKNILNFACIYAAKMASVEFTGNGSLELKGTDSSSTLDLEIYSDGILTLGVSGQATLTVDAAEDKTVDCPYIKDGSIIIKGNCPPFIKEQYSEPVYVDVITSIDEETLSGNSYRMAGDVNGLYMIKRGNWGGSSIYKLIKHPDQDKGIYISLNYGYIDGDIPKNFTSAGTVSYNSCSLDGGNLYKKSGKDYIVCDVYEENTKQYILYAYESHEFVKFVDLNGSEKTYMLGKKGEKIGTNEDWGNIDNIMKDRGYEKVVFPREGYYNIYSKDAQWILRATHATHAGTAVAGKAATCTADGSKAYYTCTCGKAFEDAACTKEIANLATWKVVKATGHDFGTNNETCSKCGAKNPNYKAPAKITKPTAASGGNKITANDKGEAAITEVKNKKSVTIPSTVTVNGAEYTVTTINANAFKKATKATAVTLPDTITKIKANAFADSKIKTVKLTVKEGAKLSIDKKAFKKSKVKTVQITISKNATKAQKNKLIKALNKAGIKTKNIKFKKK